MVVVFYAGITFRQTLQEDWCMDTGGMIKQDVYDYCVFNRISKENKQNDMVVDEHMIKPVK
ncbi:hypothetical protein CRYPD_251 [uncultured Candidatus Thioglobus sp.]|nr:hypothetical protein CRYPD_251 [uncultured Candidatus Thioglobus sp.]